MGGFPSLNLHPLPSKLGLIVFGFLHECLLYQTELVTSASWYGSDPLILLYRTCSTTAHTLDCVGN
jgi:hypothetical protein